MYDALVELLTDVVSPIAKVSWNASTKLRELGSAANDAVSFLIRHCIHELAHVRASAAHALGTVGAGHRAVVPVLVGVLADHDVDARRLAADALGQLGFQARVAVGALIDLLHDEHAIVAGSAARSLRQIGFTPGERIRIAVYDRHGFIEPLDAWLHERFGLLDSVVLDLADALRDDNANVRSRAAEVLGYLGPSLGGMVIPLLQRVLEDHNARVRLCAARAIGDIGRTPAAPACTLTEALQKCAMTDSEKDVRRAATRALRVVAPSAFRPTARARVYLMVEKGVVLIYPVVTTRDGQLVWGDTGACVWDDGNDYAGRSYDELASLGTGVHEIEFDADTHFDTLPE